MNWKMGRQGGGYMNLQLLKLKKVDCYLLKYPTDTGIVWHVDPVEGHKHYRLNITLWPWFRREACELKGYPLFRLGPILLFRPDQVMHRVLIVTNLTRYVLSIGWAIKVE